MVWVIVGGVVVLLAIAGAVVGVAGVFVAHKKHEGGSAGGYDGGSAGCATYDYTDLKESRPCTPKIHRTHIHIYLQFKTAHPCRPLYTPSA